jgi:hypothetical protein
MAITMTTTMAETTMSPRRGILVRWNAISAIRLGIMQMIAHRGRMKETGPFHSIPEGACQSHQCGRDL